MRMRMPMRLRLPLRMWTPLRNPLAFAFASLALVACEDWFGSGDHSTVSQGSSTDLDRGPFLAETTTDSIVVAWSTAGTGLGSVEYWTGAASIEVRSEASSTRHHRIEIDGLNPGTLYDYQVVTDGIVLAQGRTFSTARTAGDPRLRFAVFGDSGSGDANQIAVGSRLGEADPDLVIHTGDLIYENGEAENFNPRYFEPYTDIIDRIPLYAALGNHDVRTLNGQPFLDALHLPHNNPAGTERYYSFEAAHARFIALDSNQSVSPGSPMRAWLEAELARPAGWKFVFFHHPPFSSALHTSDLNIRRDLEPLFIAGGVDVVFNGHDHVYERTFPLQNATPVNSNEEPDYVRPAGVVYVVTGGGGRPLYARTQVNGFTARFESVHHFVRVDLQDTTLALTAVRSDGVEFDSMTIAK